MNATLIAAVADALCTDEIAAASDIASLCSMSVDAMACERSTTETHAGERQRREYAPKYSRQARYASRPVAVRT